MDDLKYIHFFFSAVSGNNLISLLSYGNDKFDTKNRKILMSTIRFIDFHIGLMGNFGNNLTAS